MNTESAQEAYRFHKKYLSPFKTVAIFVYYVFVPFLQTPDWCLNNATPDEKTAWLYKCEHVLGGTVKYSDLPKLAPWVTGTLDFICLFILAFFRFSKLRWRAMSPKAKWRNYSLAALWVICTGDIIYSLVPPVNYPYLTNFLRPIVIMIFLSQLRNNMKFVVLTAKDALVILICIFSYIGFFTMVGYFLFKGTFQMYSTFSSLGATYY